MKNFLKKNWFKITFSSLCVLAVILWGYALYLTYLQPILERGDINQSENIKSTQDILDEKKKELSDVQSQIDAQNEENRYQELLKEVEDSKEALNQQIDNDKIEKQKNELLNFEDSYTKDASSYLPQPQTQEEERRDDPQITIEKCKITAKKQAGEKIGKYKAKNKMPTTGDYANCLYRVNPRDPSLSEKAKYQPQACAEEFEMMMDQFNQEVEIVYSQYYDKYYSDCLSK